MGLLDALRGAKVGERSAAEVRASTYVERQALVAERERAAEARAIDCEQLAHAVRDADARVAVLDAELKAARDTALRAHQAFAARAAQADALVARGDAQLERGADPRIDACFVEFEHEFQEQRHSSAHTPALVSHLAGLRQGQRECQALKLAAVPDIAAALEEIRSRLPSKFASAA